MYHLAARTGDLEYYLLYIKWLPCCSFLVTYPLKRQRIPDNNRVRAITDIQPLQYVSNSIVIMVCNIIKHLTTVVYRNSDNARLSYLLDQSSKQVKKKLRKKSPWALFHKTIFARSLKFAFEKNVFADGVDYS